MKRCYGGLDQPPSPRHRDLDPLPAKAITPRLQHRAMTSAIPRPSKLSFSLLQPRRSVKRLYFCHLSISQRAIANMERPSRPRRFAPLDPAKRTEGDKRPLLKGIVFDVDGTLCGFLLDISGLLSPVSMKYWRHCPPQN